ncbi:hypothetical protein DCAR_0415255 [Daucus carota subsp. sativus]|uniref:Uncharacterized protein n=1 Tax=Daucus carota subsp. sativus TaxID=79200 RepID=A0A165A9C7_DAUCS|nr:hypothetical protein DCAR_0415255 [Daucus carota subsp. sativus]
MPLQKLTMTAEDNGKGAKCLRVKNGIMAAAAAAGGREGSKGDGVCGEKADSYSKASVSNVFQDYRRLVHFGAQLMS